MRQGLKLYTLQGSYTLEKLRNEGIYSSTISNDEISETLFRDKLGKGLVYFYATEDLSKLSKFVNRDDERILLELDSRILNRKHLLFSIERYSNLKVMCNCTTKYVKGGRDNDYLEILYEGLGIDNAMLDFLQSCSSPSGVYVGIVGSIYNKDVKTEIKEKTIRLNLGGID